MTDKKNTPKLIGITGKAGAGKDTTADYLFERHAFLKIALADPLKAAASAVFGVNLRNFYDRDLKEQVVEFWNLSPRQMAQLLGTEAVKSVFGDSVWVKRWLMSYRVMGQTDSIVVPDVRFEEEAEVVRTLGGTILHLHRDSAGLAGATGRHVSEGGIAFAAGDVRIDNNGTYADLYRQVDEVLN